MKLFFFIPSLNYSGAAKQLLLLAAGLPRERFTVRVCTLGRSAPWAETLRAAGVAVQALNWHRILDLRPLLYLRRTLRDFRPDVVHVWGLPVIWVGLLLRRWTGGRLVVSSALLARNRAGQLSGFDRWALGPSAYQLVVSGPGEAERCRHFGIPVEKIVSIPPAVAPLNEPGGSASEIRTGLGLPPEARLLVCVGPLEAAKSYREAIWAFDMLKYLYPDLRFVLAGEGPDRLRLERFAHALNAEGEVRFPGPLSELAPLLHAAEVVWVPGRVGGINVALEAMAAGKPVVAARQPVLAEMVSDGETGMLFPPGDKAALARHTRTLLDVSERRQLMGEAGRRRAEAFSVEELVRRHVQLYQGL